MGFVVNGLFFGKSKGHSSVTIAGLPLTIVHWGATSITVQIPTGGASSGDIVVTVGGIQSNGTPFFVDTPFSCELPN